MVHRAEQNVNGVASGVLPVAQLPPTMPAMKLGAALRAMRKEAGLTAEDLAERAGTTKSTVSRIENELQAPSFDMLERLAAGLEIKVYQLIARAENVTLPTAKAAPAEQNLLRDLRAMEPDLRDQYAALARRLAKKGR